MESPVPAVAVVPEFTALILVCTPFTVPPLFAAHVWMYMFFRRFRVPFWLTSGCPLNVITPVPLL